jgi:propionyl-CoA carboxylase alpha chain
VPVLDSVEVGSDGQGAFDALSYPVLVKAAAGGGGKGMRVVRDRANLADALAASSREAAAAFGDARVFVEPYLEGARHVEIQILGDRAGHLVHCGERECSIQRRHQKIIEEAPSTAVDARLREEMGAAALRAAGTVGYEGAGTVEFLLGDDGRYFFLEVNTRLQVEHGVTEAVTGLDLVREQLLVAEGASLGFTQGEVTITGHAVEARLYAEDPETGYLPSAGRITAWREATSPVVRYDSGIETESEIGIEFDPMLAKVIAHAPTRPEAVMKLALALERTVIHGVKTNRDLLVSVLRDESFAVGRTTTAFLDERPVVASRAVADEDRAAAAVAAVLSAAAERRRSARTLVSFPSGWRNGAMPPESVVFRDGDEELTVNYRHRRDGAFDVEVFRRTTVAHWLDRPDGEGELQLDGHRVGATITRDGSTVSVDLSSGAAVDLVEHPRFPEPERKRAAGALVAPMPGSVLSTHVQAGDTVEAGQLLVIVEAMKMEHRVTAPAAGKVTELQATPGAQVRSGDLLVSIEPIEPTEPTAPTAESPPAVPGPATTP